MSKTKGNVIDPLDIILGAPADQLAPSLRNKFPQGMPAFGADALRFTLASLSQQGRDIKLSIDRVGGYRAFANKLWNASRFALINLGDFRSDERFIKDRRLTLADRWILARLNKVIGEVGRAIQEFQFSEAASALYQFLWHEFCDWYIELSKGALYGEQAEPKQSTRAVLVFCLDHILRLLHPFMPFITEEIWQKLPLVRTVDSVMIAPFPTPDERLADPEAEQEMAPLIEVIEGIRNLRGENNLPPSAKVPALIISPDPRIRQTLQKWSHYLIPLAGLGSLEVRESGPRPAQAAPFVGSAMEIFIPLTGLIDVKEERGRLSKEIAKVTADLEGLSRKLENPNFVSKAPAEVVEKDRARMKELQLKKAKLQEHLGRINPESPSAS
jgi:valyl-tRNA synthetase